MLILVVQVLCSYGRVYAEPERHITNGFSTGRAVMRAVGDWTFLKWTQYHLWAYRLKPPVFSLLWNNFFDSSYRGFEE
jgi:hypothetical protein